MMSDGTRRAPADVQLEIESYLNLIDRLQTELAELRKENELLKHELSLFDTEPNYDELPGMWDKSDLIGGQTDCEPPANKESDNG